jgi:large repetitive protein
VTDYDTAVLAAVPDGYWKLDETSGLSLADSSGNAHPLVGTGVFAEGYHLPGPNPNEIPAALDLTSTGTPAICATGTVGAYAAGHSFTVEGWWAGVGPVTSTSSLIAKGYNSVEQRPWWALGVDTSGRALFWLRTGAGVDYEIIATGALNDATYPQHGPFHHLMGVFSNAGTMKLYVDGVLAAQLAGVANTGYGTGAQGLTLGQFANNRQLGWVAAMAIYPTAFTDAGALDHFTTGMKGNAFYPSQLASQLGELADLLKYVSMRYVNAP